MHLDMVCIRADIHDDVPLIHRVIVQGYDDASCISLAQRGLKCGAEHRFCRSILCFVYGTLIVHLATIIEATSSRADKQIQDRCPRICDW